MTEELNRPLEEPEAPRPEEEAPAEAEETSAGEGPGVPPEEIPQPEETEEVGEAQEEAAAAGPSAETPPEPEERPLVAPEVTSDDRVWALLAYFLPLLVPIFILMVEPNRLRPFQRYHAIHSLVYTVAAIAYEVALMFGFFILGAIPILSCLLFCLWPLVFAPLLPYLWYGLQAYQGQWVTIPVLTDFIRQQGWVD